MSIARGRTITETDNIWFTLLTMNTHPLHFDNAYAAKSEFKQTLVNSCLTLSMIVGMSVSDVSQKAIGKKDDGKQFMSFERTVLVPKRGHGVED